MGDQPAVSRSSSIRPCGDRSWTNGGVESAFTTRTVPFVSTAFRPDPVAK